MPEPVRRMLDSRSCRPLAREVLGLAGLCAAIVVALLLPILA